MPSPIKVNLFVIYSMLILIALGLGCASPKIEKKPEPVMTDTESTIETETPVIKEETIAEAPSEPQDYLHIVRWHGENLSIIAKWYTGKSSNWHQLAEANPKVHPHRIYIGTRILIPEHLLNTRKPLPKSFVQK